MTLLKKSTPGSAPGGLEWNSADDVVEVPPELAVALLAIPDAGFTEQLPEPDGESEGDPEVTEPAESEEITEPAPDPEVTEPKPRRPRKP